MNVFIAISQTARVAAVWARSQTTKQILITISIISYTALLMEREKKISKYYDKTDDSERRPERTNREDREVP